MAGEFEEVLKLTIQDGEVSDFVTKVLSAFSEISDGAKRATASGDTSGARGATGGFRRAEEHVATQIKGAGLSAVDTNRYLATVREASLQSAKVLTQAFPKFTTGRIAPEDQFLLRELAAGQKRDTTRESVAGETTARDKVRIGGDRFRARDSDPALLDVADKDLSALERATRAKINSAVYNSAAATDPRYRQAALSEAIGLKRTNTAYNDSLAGSATYKKEFGANEVSEKNREAAENSALSTRAYGDANARAAASVLKRQVTEDNGKIQSEEYNKQLVRRATSLKNADAKESGSLAASPGYNKAFGNEAKNAKLQEAAEQAALTTKAYARANASAATAILERKTLEENAKTGSKGYGDAEAGLTAELNRQKAAIAKAKTGSEGYRSSVGDAATQSKLLEAAEEGAKSTKAYTEANAKAATAILQRQAGEEAAKTASAGHAKAEVTLATRQNEQAAKIAGIKSGSTETGRAYQTSVGKEATTAKLQEAAENAAKSTKAYGDANAAAAASLLKRQTTETDAKTQSDEYGKQVVRRATSLKNASANESKSLAASPGYNRAFGDDAKNAKLREAAEQAALTTKAYANANAEAATAILERRSGEAAAKTASAGYAKAQVGLATNLNDQAAKIAAVKAGNSKAGTAYQASVGNEAVQSKLQEAAENAARNTKAFASANEQAARSALELKNALEEAKTGSKKYIEAEVGAANELLQRQSKLAEAKLADGNYVRNTAETAEAMAKLKAGVAEAAAASDAYASEARIQVANTRTKRNVQAKVLADTTDDDNKAQGALQAAAAAQKIAVTRAQIEASKQDIPAEIELATETKNRAADLARQQAGDDAYIAAEADLVVALKARKDRINATVDALTGQTSAGGGGSTGKTATGFQRLQAHFDPDPDADPLKKRTFGQFVGSHALSTAGYAVPGLAFGVGLEELRLSVKEAENAQVAFSHLKAQFDALGQSSQLAGFTTSIKSIASSTGLATSEVADLALGMKGVYGSTDQATVALQGISNAAVAMGITTEQAAQNIIAITQSFDGLRGAGGSAVAAVTNQALTLQDKTGVRATDITAGVAEAGPTANQFGFGEKETAAIIAAAAQVSHAPAAELGQTFAKLVGGISQNYASIYGVYQTTPSLQKELPQLNKDTPAQAFLQIIKDLGTDKIPGAEKYQIFKTLGINASAIPQVADIAQGAPLAAKLAGTPVDPNRTADEAKFKESTLTGELNKLRADVTNLGVAILDSGVGTGLVDVAKAAGATARFFTTLNSKTDGLVGKFVEVVAALAGLKLAIAGIKALGKVTGIIKKEVDPTTLAAQKLTGSAVALGRSAVLLGDAAIKLGATGGLSGVGGGGVGGTVLKDGDAAIKDDGLLKRGALALGGKATIAGDAFGLPEQLAFTAAFAGTTALLNGPLNNSIGKPLQHFANAVFGSPPPNTGLAAAGQPVGIALGSNPYGSITIDSQGVAHYGVKGKRESKQELDDQAKTRNQIEGELNKAAPKLTAQQQYSITTDEKYADLGSRAAFNNLIQLYGTLGGGAPGVAADPDLRHVIDSTNKDDARSRAVAQSTGLSGKAAILGAPAARQAAAAAEKTTLANESANEDFTGVQTGYEAGDQSYKKLVTFANLNVTAARQAFATTPGTDTFEALESAISAKNAILDQAIADQNQESDLLDQVGNISDDSGRIDRYTKAVGKSKGLQAKQAAAGGIVSALQAVLADKEANATSLSDAQKIANTGVTANKAQLAAYNQAHPNAHLDHLTVHGQAATHASTLAALNQDTQAVQAEGVAAAHEDPVLVAVANFNAAVATLGNDVAAGYGPSSAQYKTDEAAKTSAAQAVTDANNAATEAAISLTQAKASAGGDSVAAAQAGIQLAQQQVADAHGLAAQLQAEAALATANRAYSDAVISLMSARTTLVATIAGATGNQVGSALANYQAAVQKANAQAAADRKAGTNPNNDTAYLADVGAESTTGESYANAVTALASAKAATAAALLNQQGDPVGAAIVNYNNALAAAAARAKYVSSHGNKPSNDAQYQSDIAQAYNLLATKQQAVISNLESVGSTQLFLGEITATQYISELEAELAKVEKATPHNKQEILGLKQQIRQVQNTAGGDLNFDIPANLLIAPTLYQAIRASKNAKTYDTRHLDVNREEERAAAARAARAAEHVATGTQNQLNHPRPGDNQPGGLGTSTVTNNDNRRVHVVINISQGSHTAAALKQLMGAMGSPTSGAATGVLPTGVLASR